MRSASRHRVRERWEASVVNLIKKGDKAILPVNGEFSSRLAQMIEWAGGEVIRVTTEPGVSATLDQVREAFDNNPRCQGILLRLE